MGISFSVLLLGAPGLPLARTGHRAFPPHQHDHTGPAHLPWPSVCRWASLSPATRQQPKSSLASPTSCNPSLHRPAVPGRLLSGHRHGARHPDGLCVCLPPHSEEYLYRHHERGPQEHGGSPGHGLDAHALPVPGGAAHRRPLHHGRYPHRRRGLCGHYDHRRLCRPRVWAGLSIWASTP